MLDKFDLHTKIFIGSASFDKMLEQRRRVFIVTDKFMHESGRVSYLTDKIKAEGAKWEIFSDVTPDPDIETVTAGVAKILDFQPDTVIALGGGSPIDAAKAIVYFAAKQIDLRDCPFVAVPTTSGTGSEVSKFAVITDRARGIKYPLIDDTLLPDYAVLDAELTCSVPPKVTADTGLDVLTHAIEAFVCTEANAFTDALAEKSVKLVDHYLLLAYKEPENREARQGMHNASCLAGAAFSNAGLGLCHSMAHAMGAQFHIPHGRANAILLPVVMSFNAGCETTLTPVATRYAELASLIGMGATSMRQSALNLIHMVRRLQQRMGVPQCIKDAGVSAEDFEAALDAMADAALADRCTATNPKPCTKEDIIELYRQAYSKSNRKGLS
ncbi:alcohol dehydrogenase [Butyricicoccus pullicaecorum]|uniref:Alcohol dehydrogenase n=1 Tax=Butyricicoccus pullicaecorum TaxID=501571 RepID=A0A1Y4LBM7_9FIRM|nr:1-propanol dehydrogenase PduQ [Butyricicoccus pullicaecorum]OUP54134.1 alcohol dehydrogenase [Butyricicoccus pullicaecorum]